MHPDFQAAAEYLTSRAQKLRSRHASQRSLEDELRWNTTFLLDERNHQDETINQLVMAPSLRLHDPALAELAPDAYARDSLGHHIPFVTVNIMPGKERLYEMTMGIRFGSEEARKVFLSRVESVPGILVEDDPRTYAGGQVRVLQEMNAFRSPVVRLVHNYYQVLHELAQ